MKFGETFTEYLHGDQEWFLEKCSHVEYKSLKKVLKTCRSCKPLGDSCKSECQLCDQKFFSELTKEASEINGCFSSRVRHLLDLHVASGMQGYLLRLRRYFKNDQQAMVLEGRMLVEYVTMNAIAIRKILKKYDKVHCSENGRNFKSKLRAEHIELLQSPLLIELAAFYLSFNGEKKGEFNEFSSQFSCDFDATPPVMKLRLPHSIKLEYDLTCAVCLVRTFFSIAFWGNIFCFCPHSLIYVYLIMPSQDVVFNSYALSCGHLFCKSCACSSASVLIFQGLKTANPESKCPICRQVGVYAKAVHMVELDMLLKKRCKDYWKERFAAERAETTKQSKEFWDAEAKYLIGY
ncbi:probable E3 ubiquitin-protein ligase BAH1-like isoform X1 [Juglans microcarpa x Juglans regia]|uniref:probable E3 ubiquitin-protein ligase BAH1-like isoform X1 n=1 Tax=Juglans microcarpa x Juglans regia TaxID=2249226 RepID=UPI001B7E8C3D|nr:probable E3 ubiquitin-protein ligase BAH1-like isoform X1 [Juglans microcarpa x Juglans regia]